MTDYEKFESWNIAVKEQGYQPIFDGDWEAALDYATNFMDVILAYQNNVINRKINLSLETPLTESIVQEKDVELREAVKIARSALAEAIVDMNRVYRAYGIEPMDIDVDDPAAINKFVKDFRDEAWQRELEISREMDKKSS